MLYQIFITLRPKGLRNSSRYPLFPTLAPQAQDGGDCKTSLCVGRFPLSFVLTCPYRLRKCEVLRLMGEIPQPME